jgi:4-hydroxy-3-polyprenylbenzoate decarboxylase
MSVDGVVRNAKQKIVVGITGASGAPYAKRLVGLLRERMNAGEIELGVCASQTAPEVWTLECGGEMRDEVGVKLWGGRDYSAPFASGSAGWGAMVIVPCSMSTVAKVAHGMSDTLLTRAADVMLKERRQLILVPRETPLSLIHLENLTQVARAGALVLPAMPSFYGKPQSLDDIIDSVVGRTLDHLGIAHTLSHRWKTPS